MFIEKNKELFELMFVECSRIFCTKNKEENDEVKLWREMNDGMNYVHKFYRPEKDEFGILGIQVAGKMMHLNVLIKDINDVNRLYHLNSIEIPIQQTNNKEYISQFIKTLLLVRNILTVNISLLLNAPLLKSDRIKRRQDSFGTVSSGDEKPIIHKYKKPKN
jgi:hypothetical protein